MGVLTVIEQVIAGEVVNNTPLVQRYVDLHARGVDLIDLYERASVVDMLLDELRNYVPSYQDWGDTGTMVYLDGLDMSFLRRAAKTNPIYSGITLPTVPKAAIMDVIMNHIQTIMDLQTHDLLTEFLPGVHLVTKKMAMGEKLSPDTKYAVGVTTGSSTLVTGTVVIYMTLIQKVNEDIIRELPLQELPFMLYYDTT